MTDANPKAGYWQGKKIKRSIMHERNIETANSFKLYTLLENVAAIFFTLIACTFHCGYVFLTLGIRPVAD